MAKVYKHSNYPLISYTFKRIQTLRELLNVASLVFFPEVRYSHIRWSTLRINFGHDLGFSGSAFWSIVAWDVNDNKQEITLTSHSNE